MHTVLRVLLLLPFAALITTIIRNVVGIGTFGTFSPALLAMSFIYANWQTGLAILLIVVMAGVVSRSLLERLRLLTVPRLTIILTLVILCVVFGLSILYYLLPEIVTDAVLLPMVILTMLIERFYVTTEEDGLMYTVQLAAGTLSSPRWSTRSWAGTKSASLCSFIPRRTSSRSPSSSCSAAMPAIASPSCGGSATSSTPARHRHECRAIADCGSGPTSWNAPAYWASTSATWRSSRKAIRADSTRASTTRRSPRKSATPTASRFRRRTPIIRRYGDVQRFTQLIGDRSEFVIKPASGAAGRGIIVIARRKGNDFETASGRIVTWGDLRYHVSTILSGLYSLGGQVDKAIVEQRIIIHPTMERIAVGGTPDVRVILYRHVPVMAMVRLPTNASEGRANLHQGAAAAAVHLVTGRTFGGVCNNRMISRHPDTGELIGGLEIPGWRDLLAAAMKLSDAMEMGYIGVDFVVDAKIGPVVLEANARPGLAIQVAHRIGLLPRLRLIESLPRDATRGERRWDVIPRIAGVETGSVSPD